ncbi:MAG: PCRF domain-containing protein, partial [Bdellovibrionales bacterium]|nr:PCRF domain-containing protein [Bdellovibrionales bacterium]
MRSGGFFDLDTKTTRLDELERASQAEDFWNDAEKAKHLLKERAACQGAIDAFSGLKETYEQAAAALELAEESGDRDFLVEASETIVGLERDLAQHEFLRKMRGEFDRSNAILEIN